ncbi:MAG TPA: hypothetical protein PK252_04300 [Bacteroidales bacterium]|nr:hypothetical protein [Bacteroidales bacterium]
MASIILYQGMTKRIVIYPKDVMTITGRSEKFSRNLLKQIRQQLDKEQHHFVTIYEFCQFTGMDAEQVQPLLVS